METELKFSPVLSGSFQSLLHDPLISPRLGKVSWSQMKTVYYDTRGGTLFSLGAALRVRLENRKTVYTFKRTLQEKGNLSVRLELESTADSLGDAIQELCADPKMPGDVKTALQQGELTPVCRADFTRASVSYTADNLCFTVCLDSGILSGGVRQDVLSELELEFGSGSLDAFLEIGRYLTRAYNLTPCSQSKFSRARALMLEVSF